LAYDAVSGTEVFRRQYELVAKDLARYRTTGSVLDIGTGPARLLLALHREAPALKLTGVDSSSPMVATARRHVADAGLASVIDVQEANASELPFPDASFDMVVSTGSIHHWKEPTPALNEVYRVLKEGGDALMYDVVSDTPASVLRETAREFGRLRILLLWLHGFEEPFYTRENFALLARPTPFREGETRFVGVLCCLALKKAKGD
ncbi:MAG: class I SAM-dependent methyltransferase, partial [Planctomycetota bacterium]